MARFSFDRINPITSKINYPDEKSGLLPMHFSRSAKNKLGKDYLVDLTDFLKNSGLTSESKDFVLTQGGVELDRVSNDYLRNINLYGGVDTDPFISGSSGFRDSSFGGLYDSDAITTKKLKELKGSSGIRLSSETVAEADVVFNLNTDKSFVSQGLAHEVAHSFDNELKKQQKNIFNQAMLETDGVESITEKGLLLNTDGSSFTFKYRIRGLASENQKEYLEQGKALGKKRLSTSELVTKYFDTVEEVEGINIPKKNISPMMERSLAFSIADDRLSEFVGTLSAMDKAGEEIPFDKIMQEAVDSGFYHSSMDVAAGLGKMEALADTGGNAAVLRVSQNNPELTKKLGFKAGTNKTVNQMLVHAVDDTPGARVTGASLAMGIFSNTLRQSVEVPNEKATSLYAAGNFSSSLDHVRTDIANSVDKLPFSKTNAVSIKAFSEIMIQDMNAVAGGVYAAKIGGFSLDGGDVSGLGKIYGELLNEELTDFDALRYLSYSSTYDGYRKIHPNEDLLKSFAEIENDPNISDEFRRNMEEVQKKISLSQRKEELLKIHEEAFLDAEREGRYNILVEDSSVDSKPKNVEPILNQDSKIAATGQKVEGRISSSREMLDVTLENNLTNKNIHRTAGVGNSRSMLDASAEAAKAVSRRDSTGMRLAGASATVLRRRLL